MELTEAQKACVDHFEGPCLVLAVPGSGKTTVLINRIENLINKGVKENEIMSITFSRSQANDMQRRYEEKFGRKSYFSTIHAFAYSIISYYTKTYKKKINLIEGKNYVCKYSLLRRIYFDVNSSFMDDELVEEFFNSYSYIKNSMLDYREFKHSPKLKNFKALYESYEAYKKENFLIDFDDMLTLALEILQNDEKILKKVRKRAKFIQVDEAQDTSKIQLEIIKLVASPLNNIFMVLDDDQSIYSFRGADPGEIKRFKESYKDSKVYLIGNNFRSSKDIVRVSSKFILSNKNRFEKEFISVKDSLRPITLVRAKNLEARDKYIVEKIESIEEDKTIAVLYRNNISSFSLIFKLKEKGLDFSLSDKKFNYLKSQSLKDILNILEFSYKPYNKEIFEKIYYKLGAYLKKDFLKFIPSYNRENIFDLLLNIEGLKPYQYQNIEDVKAKFEFLQDKGVYRRLLNIDRLIDYRSYLENSFNLDRTNLRNYDIIMESLLSIAYGVKSYEELTEKIESIYELESGPKRISLSTVHSSKGLEYDYVFIVDLNQDEFPGINSSLDERLLEEERRLFYVAMTRAKEGLFLVSQKTRNGLAIEPSKFYQEIKAMKNSK